MNKNDFRRLVRGDRMSLRKREICEIPSVTDPSYAQSGRQMLTNPKPYECKPIYKNGVPLDQMQAFDGMYVDKIAAHSAAQEFSEKQRKEIKEKLGEYEKSKNKKDSASSD